MYTCIFLLECRKRMGRVRYSHGLCFGVIIDRIVRSYEYSYDRRGTRISALASSFKYNQLDLIDNASRQSHPCRRCQRENIGCSQSEYNQSASSIFGKDVEHDFPKEIKTKIKFAFVRDVREALEEAFGKEVVEGWKKMGGGRKQGPSRRGRGGDDVNGDDDEWDGSEGGGDQDVFERRGVVWVRSWL